MPKRRKWRVIIYNDDDTDNNNNDNNNDDDYRYYAKSYSSNSYKMKISKLKQIYLFIYDLCVPAVRCYRDNDSTQGLKTVIRLRIF